MIRLGYVTGNRMTNLLPRNTKLRERSIRIFAAETGADEETARVALDAANNDLRTALVMHRTGRTRDEAERALGQSRNVVQKAVDLLLSKD